MARAGKDEIRAELDALRRLAREVIATSKGKRPVAVKDQRALRQQRKRTVAAIHAEITELKHLRRRVLQAAIPDGMAEKLLP